MPNARFWRRAVTRLCLTFCTSFCGSFVLFAWWLA